LLLTNATYFSGPWALPFDPKQTRNAQFWTDPRHSVRVPMMHLHGRFRMLQADGFRALELPYQGGNVAMVVFLPDRIGGLTDLGKALTHEHCGNWLASLANSQEPQHVRVYLPWFTIHRRFPLREILSQLGMSNAFNPEIADFSGLSDKEGLYLSDAFHRAYVGVDEIGTEAAAATAAVFRPRSPESYIFQVDHPFIFLIYDKSTSSILFLGRVVNPAS